VGVRLDHLLRGVECMFGAELVDFLPWRLSPSCRGPLFASFCRVRGVSPLFAHAFVPPLWPVRSFVSFSFGGSPSPSVAEGDSFFYLSLLEGFSFSSGVKVHDLLFLLLPDCLFHTPDAIDSMLLGFPPAPDQPPLRPFSDLPPAASIYASERAGRLFAHLGCISHYLVRLKVFFLPLRTPHYLRRSRFSAGRSVRILSRPLCPYGFLSILLGHSLPGWRLLPKGNVLTFLSRPVRCVTLSPFGRKSYSFLIFFLFFAALQSLSGVIRDSDFLGRRQQFPFRPLSEMSLPFSFPLSSRTPIGVHQFRLQLRQVLGLPLPCASVLFAVGAFVLLPLPTARPALEQISDLSATSRCWLFWITAFSPRRTWRPFPVAVAHSFAASFATVYEIGLPYLFFIVFAGYVDEGSLSR